MRGRTLVASALVFGATVGMTWGALSAAAEPGDDPTPTATATGNSQVGFTVPDTSSPTPSPSPSTGGGGHGGGGGGGGAGGGGTGGGGTTPPACMPTTTTPKLDAGPTSGAGTLRVRPGHAAQGSDVVVTGDGFQPGEKVVLALYSSPVKLGVFTVRSTGQVYAQVTIPRRTQLGAHTIQATGFQDCKVSAAQVEIVSPSGPGHSNFPWMAWVVAGGGVGIAGVCVFLAFLFGWLPNAFVVGVATRAAP